MQRSRRSPERGWPMAGAYGAVQVRSWPRRFVSLTRARHVLSPGERGSLGIKAFAPIAWYVTKATVLGAN